MLKPNTFAYTNNSVTLLSMLIMLWLAYITITQLVKQDNQTREVAYTPQPVLFQFLKLSTPIPCAKRASFYFYFLCFFFIFKLHISLTYTLLLIEKKTATYATH